MMFWYPKEVARETDVVTLGYNSLITLIELGLICLVPLQASTPTSMVSYAR